MGRRVRGAQGCPQGRGVTVCPDVAVQDKFLSREGKSKHQLWQELCVLISKNPNKVQTVLYSVLFGCFIGVCVPSYTFPPSFPPPPPPPPRSQISSLKVEPIIRGGLRRFTDMIGQLWCSLADYYIRAGHFEKVALKLARLLYPCNSYPIPPSLPSQFHFP